jgi:hypothetical protein
MATIDELYQQYLLSQQPPLGGSPTTLTPYQRIMGQMTPTMNPYTGANVAIGGYDPALYSRMSGSGLINTGRGGGGGAGGSGGGSGGFESVPSAWDNMTPAQQAAYYAANPNMAAITQFGQKAFGFTTPGMVQNYFVPEFVANMSARAMGYDPANLSYGGASRAEQDAMNAALAAQAAESYGGASMAEQQAMNDALGEAAVGSYGGASMAEQQAMNDALGSPGQSVSDSAASAAGGYGSGDSAGFGGGTDSGSDGWAKGGKVTKDRLKGPDPKGPDEGYGALLSGEYVIKKSAVKKYGQGLLDMINDGKIPAKKMKSLLG